MKSKRILLVLMLVFVLTLPGLAAAEGEGALDALFAAGKAELTEIPMAGIQLTADNVLLTPEHQAQLDANPEWKAHALDGMYALSVAPSGQSALLVSGEVLLVWYDGQAREVTFSAARSVADEFGNQEKLLSRGLMSYANAQLSEVVWSPDGRYLTVTAMRTVVMNAQLYLDPFIIDCQTGEMFFVATYSPKIFGSNGAGAPSAARFSADGKYAYFMMYGRFGERRTALVRYDLINDRMETCCSITDTDYFPLLELQDGSLLVIKDTYQKSKPMGLARYVPYHDNWMYFEQPLTLFASGWRAANLHYSAASGYAVVCYEMLQTGAPISSAFQTLQPDITLHTGDLYWGFSAETGELTAQTSAEIKGLFQESAASEEGKPPVYEAIIDACLSPDGHYALFRTVLMGQWHLRLVELDTMKQLEVTGVSEDQLVSLRNSNSMLWQGGVISFGNVKGTHTYQFLAAE